MAPGVMLEAPGLAAARADEALAHAVHFARARVAIQIEQVAQVAVVIDVLDVHLGKARRICVWPTSGAQEVSGSGPVNQEADLAPLASNRAAGEYHVRHANDDRLCVGLPVR